MKKVYDEEEEMFGDLKKDIEDCLINEALEKVKDIEVFHIKRDVLDSYSPTFYKRRASNGIDDRNNIVGHVRNMVLEVDNVTAFNSGYGTSNSGEGLADLINGGDGTNGHYYDFAGTFNKPRKFLENSIDEVENTDLIENTLLNSLKKKGYEIK